MNHSRIYKFRAWLPESKKMFNDVYFNSTEVLMYDEELEEGLIIGDRFKHSLLPYCILMQYTGRKDKNGKEIYEGDIVQTYYDKRLKGGKAVIKYLGCSFCMTQETDDTELDCVWFNICEVLGNIYENPKLLKEKNDKIKGYI